MNPNEIDAADAIVVLSGGGRTISSKTSKIFEWNDPDDWADDDLLAKWILEDTMLKEQDEV